MTSTIDMKYPFNEEQFKLANAQWGCNCGPSALAFALQVPLESVRPAIPEFDRRRYTSPTMMKQALANLQTSYTAADVRELNHELLCVPFDAIKFDYSNLFHDQPSLVRVQFCGPWTKPGSNPKWAYRQTHWIATWRELWDWMVFDCNGGVRLFESWQSDILPHLTPPRGDGGWFPTHCWTITGGTASPEISNLKSPEAAR